MALDYLQGSTTGGILQGLQPAPQSYVPAISGTQPQQYTPGYGTAPYADPVATGAASAVSGAVSGASGAIGAQMASIQKLLDTKTVWSPGQKELLQSQLAALGSKVAPATSGTTAATGSDTMVSGGQGWMSPEEMRAQLNGLQTRGGSTLGGSSGGGGGGGGAGGGGSGLLSGGAGAMTAGNNMPPSYSSPGFSTQQNISTQPVGYQAPQGAAGYNAPGMLGGAQGGQGMLQMNQANPQSALDAYKNTAGYQLLNAPGAYEQSPGYQYAMDQALGQVQNKASARGMLESGAALRDMTKTATGLAQQDYGNWWNRQNQLYGDYQNRLAGLAGGSTGGDQAMQTGALQGQNSMQTGENLATLFGNQGTSGLGAYTATGAAQTNNMNQAANTQLQVNSANNSALMAGAMMNRGAF